MNTTSTNEYHFITHWRVTATLDEVNAVLGDALSLPRWWPSVYLDVKEIAPGRPDGVGRMIGLYTKGWLPYTLKWQFRVTEVRYPDGFALEAWGDFVGRGIWTFAQEDDTVVITYDWKIVAEKALLKYLSFIMKPIFAANHHWAMARGLESLRVELQLRRAKTPDERRAIPVPPGPSFQLLIPRDGAASESAAGKHALTGSPDF